MVQERVLVKAKFFATRKVLAKFLLLLNVLDDIRSYIDELEIEERNGKNGKLWKEKLKHFEGKFVMPIFVYFDDLEVNNSLGSRKGIQKLGAVYLPLPFLPPQHRYRLENIFLTLLFHSSEPRFLRGMTAFLRD